MRAISLERPTSADAARREGPTGRRARAGLVVAAALLTAACGYSTKRLVEEPGVSTVAVAQFDNKTYRRDLEFRLTKTLAEEVRARTPWRIATTETADAILSGTIRLADATVLFEQYDEANTPVLKRYRVEADCTLVERRTGRVLRRFTVVDHQDFAPNTYGETLDASATDAVVRSLSQSIVAGLERPIGDPNSIPPDERKRAIPPRFPSSDPATRPPTGGSPPGTTRR